MKSLIIFILFVVMWSLLAYLLLFSWEDGYINSIRLCISLILLYGGAASFLLSLNDFMYWLYGSKHNDSTKILSE